MKASDLDEDLILTLVRECNEARCNGERHGYTGYHGGLFGYAQGEEDPPQGHWLNRWDIGHALGDPPEKVVLAKLRRMIRNGTLDGCACGCRADLQLPGDPFV